MGEGGYSEFCLLHRLGPRINLVLLQTNIWYISHPGGIWGGDGGTLNFVCYVAGLQYLVFTSKKYTVYQPYPKKKISADISIPKQYSSCFLFIKVWFSFIVAV